MERRERERERERDEREGGRQEPERELDAPVHSAGVVIGDQPAMM